MCSLILLASTLWVVILAYSSGISQFNDSQTKFGIEILYVLMLPTIYNLCSVFFSTSTKNTFPRYKLQKGYGLVDSWGEILSVLFQCLQ